MVYRYLACNDSQSKFYTIISAFHKADRATLVKWMAAKDAARGNFSLMCLFRRYVSSVTDLDEIKTNCTHLLVCSRKCFSNVKSQYTR